MIWAAFRSGGLKKKDGSELEPKDFLPTSNENQAQEEQDPAEVADRMYKTLAAMFPPQQKKEIECPTSAE
jgi:hypothetical protein